jgi:L-fuconolactonase
MMRITDAQAHVYLADRPDRPWPEGGAAYAHTTGDYTPQMLIEDLDAAGVDRVVLVPPSFEGDYNDLALQAAVDHPDRFAVMGRIVLDDPASRDIVPTWRDQPGALGFRLTFSQPRHRAWLTDGTADWFFAAAEQAGLPVMIFAPGSLSALSSVAERHPGLRIVLDHLCIDTKLRDAEIDGPIADALELARHPNVAVKASSLPSIVTESYPFPSLAPRIERIVTAYGPERTFWGSDLTRLPCTYRQSVTHFTEELDFLGPDELEWIMGRGVSEWLGWEDPAA